MRYYSFIIEGAPAAFPARYDEGAQWGTTLNGVHDPNAQQVEFQLQEYSATAPTENSVVTIYGVSWDQILACNQLVGKTMHIFGGMSAPGLPLAVVQATRPRYLMTVKILKCWGNWIGTETSIGMSFVAAGAAAAEQGGGGGDSGGGGGGGDGGGGGAGAQSVRVNRTGFRSIDRRPLSTGPSRSGGINLGSVFSILGGSLISESDIGAATSEAGGIVSSFFGGGNISPLSAPLNLIHNMMPNMPMSSAIQETLSKAFPSAGLNILISNALKLGYQDAGMHQSIDQYAGYINKISQSIMGTNRYPGVNISSFSNTINVWDGTYPVSSGDISYLDLIGQPTWLNINTVSIKIVLRGGLHIGGTVTLPQTLVGFGGADSQVGGVPDQRSHISLPGSYLIVKVLHIGDFRNPDGASWSTNLEVLTQGSIPAQPSTESTTLPQNEEPFFPGTKNITVKPIGPGAAPQSRLMRRSVR